MVFKYDVHRKKELSGLDNLFKKVSHIYQNCTHRSLPKNYLRKQLGSYFSTLMVLFLSRSQIDYTISPNTNGSSFFSIHKVSDRAELRIQQSLRGNSGTQLVTVIASDRGSPPRSISKTIAVIVIDMNLHTPVFTRPDQSNFDISLGQYPEISIQEVLLSCDLSIYIFAC